ncbi:dTMP kinase [Streptomyces sp. NPDC018584]|uniref:dTMP kinase n=1 Tax=unclassified Streptomyces TaxID=2593676 RepID=UPI0037B39EA0
MSLPTPYQPVDFGGAAGPLIVFEGVSGIGKSTLTKTLVSRLGGTGIHTLSMPHSGWSDAANCKLRSLPQFAFYLSGVLHGSDAIRRARQIGPVVADRYVSSVVACHAAVHGIEVDVVTRLMEPFRQYLEVPTRTFYLRCSERALRARMATKQDLKQDDTDLFAIPARLRRLVDNFEAVAAADPTAVVVDTDDRTPEELTNTVLSHLEDSSA